MKRLAVWLGSILLVLSVIGGGSALAWYKYQQISAAMAAEPPAERPISVLVKPIVPVKYRRHTTVIGTVLANQSISLSNEVSGTVTKVGFTPGDIVEKDHVLIELDTSVERAQLKSSAARAQIAASNLKRTQAAAQSNAVTVAEVEEAEAQFQQAEADVQQLQAVIAKKTLRAPFRAKIGLANTHVGQFLPSGTSIASLQSIDDFVFVDFMVPQSAADSLKPGMTVDLIIHSEPFQSQIYAIDSRADKATRNIGVRVKLSPVPSQLVPGDSVRVQVAFGPEIEAMGVPPEAVRNAPMRTYVYVAEPDKSASEKSSAKGEPSLRAHSRDVILGPTVDGMVAVLKGLDASDRIIADGSFKLREGGLIFPAHANPANAKADSTAKSE